MWSLVKYIGGKITDKVIDDPAKAWLVVATMFTSISGFLIYFENLANACKFILFLATPVIFMSFYTLWLVAGDRWIISRRANAIKRGMNRIFEGDTQNKRLIEWVAAKWFATSGNDNEFNEKENINRFLLAETNGWLELTRVTDSNLIGLGPEEMERWLTSQPKASVPKAWFS